MRLPNKIIHDGMTLPVLFFSVESYPKGLACSLSTRFQNETRSICVFRVSDQKVMKIYVVAIVAHHTGLAGRWVDLNLVLRPGFSKGAFPHQHIENIFISLLLFFLLQPFALEIVLEKVHV